MARVKRGVTAHSRHKKVLALTKGHIASKHKLYRRAHESMLHSLTYAYFHRKERKGDMRRLWNVRINAAARAQGLTYGQLIAGLRKAGIAVNRKMLAEMAVSDAAAFAQVLSAAKGQS